MPKHVYSGGKKIATIKTQEEVNRDAGGTLVLIVILAAAAPTFYIGSQFWYYMTDAGIHSFFKFVLWSLIMYAQFRLIILNEITRKFYFILTSFFDAYWSYKLFQAFTDDQIWSVALAIAVGSLLCYGFFKWHQYYYDE